MLAACVVAAPGLPASPAVARERAGLAAERQLFRQARAALARHDLARVVALRKRLDGYPLAGYLDIRLAAERMRRGSDDTVPLVLARYPDLPDARDLRDAWIRDLARRGQWPAVARQLRLLPAAGVRHPGIAILARFYTGDVAGAVAAYEALWRRGGGDEDRLRPVARAWRRAGGPTAEARWERACALMERGRWSRVRPLLDGMSATDRQLMRRWRSGRRHPAAILARWPLPARVDRHEARVLARLLRLLSRRDPPFGGRRRGGDGAGGGVVAAWRAADRLRRAFDPVAWGRLRRRLALRAARRQLPQAVEWLASLPEQVQSDGTRAWRARLLLADGDWPGVLRAIAAMPPEQRHRPEWAYWQARALEQLGYGREARALFGVLAGGRGYFSFLSAERLGLPYRLSSSSAEPDAALRRALLRLPGIRRAREWLRLGLPAKARREWFRALQRVDVSPEGVVAAAERRGRDRSGGERMSARRKWYAAARLARDWGWFDRAILAAQRAGAVEDLPLRFPLAWSRHVRRAAARTGLDPALIWSVIRQESAFNAQAVSAAGARGLMQLRPSTAAMVWRRMAGRRGRPDLFDPRTNIMIGSRYLAAMVRRFDGNLALAVAAFNAGPARVARWLRRRPWERGDLWVAAIPFRETRRYVQQVLTYAAVYDWRLGGGRRSFSISRRLGGGFRLALAGE